MLYFILCRSEYRYELLYLYKTFDDALCFIINNVELYESKSSFSYYYVAVVNDNFDRYFDLSSIRPTYALYYDHVEKNYSLHYYGMYNETISCHYDRDKIPKFYERLDMLNKLLSLSKNEIYQLYKMNINKKTKKIFSSKYAMIITLFKYSKKNELEFFSNDNNHNNNKFISLIN